MVLIKDSGFLRLAESLPEAFVCSAHRKSFSEERNGGLKAQTYQPTKNYTSNPQEPVSVSVRMQNKGSDFICLV